jgi:anthranilate synthase component 1
MHVRLEGRRASLRPIAGTRRRGETPEKDAALEQDLLADPKERAEHVMLVDLGRNDLGRVCEFGSVSVSELMGVERYSHVMHIVSQVEGRLKPEVDSFDLLRATFPAGTVSGAPRSAPCRSLAIWKASRAPMRRGGLFLIQWVAGYLHYHPHW